jgi:hypothetical protein
MGLSKEDELVLTICNHILEGRSISEILRTLAVEPIDTQKACSLIDYANKMVSKELRLEGKFQTGDTDSNGMLRWKRPDVLFCSDKSCPCSGKESLIPGTTGFLWIGKEVVEMRLDAPTLIDLELKLKQLQDKSRSGCTYITGGTINPIFVCRQAATMRGLDFVVAANDAKEWYDNGLVPLRPTPLVSRQPTANINVPTTPAASEIPKEKKWWQIWQ